MEAPAILAALADPTRRMLFESLVRDGAQPVHRLTERAGISQPAVSKHLRRLSDAGLVTGTVEGRSTIYAVPPGSLDPLLGWTLRYATFWEDRLDRLETLLRRME